MSIAFLSCFYIINFIIRVKCLHFYYFSLCELLQLYDDSVSVGMATGAMTKANRLAAVQNFSNKKLDV